MTKARDISEYGGEKGIGNPVGDANEIFSWVGTAVTVTSNLTLDTSNSGPSGSYVFIREPQLDIETGIGLTVGSGRILIVDSMNLP